MKVVFIILICVAVAWLLFFLIGCHLTKKRVVRHFETGNVIVFGHKGKGKDLVFQKVINSRKKPYHSNLDYGGDYHPFALKDFDLKNDYRNFIQDNVQVVDKSNYPYEKEDVYISDGGIVLPSTYDGILSKVYPSYPVAFALSRHLWANNFHINTQAIGRVWIKLREQADYFVEACGVYSLPLFLIVKVRTYDKLESATQNLLPYEKGLINLNKYDKALVNQWHATNGEVKEGFLIISKRSIKYDTRAYHTIIFGNPAPSNKRKRKFFRGLKKKGGETPLDETPKED